MIIYDSKRLCFVFRWKGSKIPQSALYALPSAALAVFFQYLIDGYPDTFQFLEHVNQSVVWSAIVIVLGALLGMRTNKAYDRFWEGITLVNQMRAEWFEAASNLTAFTLVAAKRDKHDKNMMDNVKEFQSVLVRLMSLTHGAALRQIGGQVEEFEVLDLQAIDRQSLAYLAECDIYGINRVEVLLHWIQVLVTESVESGVIDVPAPIVSRAFQTLSRGMVNLHNARKLADVPFPFPLSQIIIALLVVQSVLTPFFVASVVGDPVYAAIITFLPIFGMWSITFIAAEIEMPFGCDENDLPLSVLQYDFNMTLLMLLDDQASRAPRCMAKRTRTARRLKEKLLDGVHDKFSMTDSSIFGAEAPTMSISALTIESSPNDQTTSQSQSPSRRSMGSITGSRRKSYSIWSSEESSNEKVSHRSSKCQVPTMGSSHQDYLVQRRKQYQLALERAQSSSVEIVHIPSLPMSHATSSDSVAATTSRSFTAQPSYAESDQLNTIQEEASEFRSESNNTPRLSPREADSSHSRQLGNSQARNPDPSTPGFSAERCEMKSPKSTPDTLSPIATPREFREAKTPDLLSPMSTPRESGRC